MALRKARTSPAQPLVEAALRGELTERQARRLYRLGPEVVTLALLPARSTDHGAATQAILMCVYRTLRLRGHNPTATLARALHTYAITGQPPALPARSSANG
jgi:hypothetical protein